MSDLITKHEALDDIMAEEWFITAAVPTSDVSTEVWKDLVVLSPAVAQDYHVTEPAKKSERRIRETEHSSA